LLLLEIQLISQPSLRVETRARLRKYPTEISPEFLSIACQMPENVGGYIIISSINRAMAGFESLCGRFAYCNFLQVTKGGESQAKGIPGALGRELRRIKISQKS
jgi:hypothetical protein